MLGVILPSRGPRRVDLVLELMDVENTKELQYQSQRSRT